MEKYMVIEPDGSVHWIEIERENMLDEFHKAIGCDTLENVRTMALGINLIVDESGKLKTSPQPFNHLASTLHLGYMLGRDFIAGPAIVAGIGLVDGESDWVPLSEQELDMLSQLGVYVDEDKQHSGLIKED